MKNSDPGHRVSFGCGIVSKSLALIAFSTSPLLHGDGDLLVSREFVQDQDIPDGGELVNIQAIDYGDATLSDVQVDLVLSGQDGPMVNGDWYTALGYDQGGYSVFLNRVGRTDDWPFGYLDNGFDVTFADGESDVHLYQDVTGELDGEPLTGTWGPSGRTSLPEEVLDTDARSAMLDSFDGQAASGEWQLFLSHESTGGAAKLERWGLDMRLTPIVGEQLRFSTGDLIRTTAPVTALTSEITISGDVTFAGDGDIESGGSLRGSGTVRQEGTGGLLLSEDADFSGSVEVTKGTLQVTNATGSATGDATVYVSLQGSLSGSGRIGGDVSIFDGGTLSPGASPGTLTIDGDLAWGEDGVYVWEINDAFGTAGGDPGWDWISIGGILNLTATDSNPFVIRIVSLDSSGLQGALAGFDPWVSQSWTVATAESFDGVYLDNLTIDATDFLAENETYGGTFSYSLAGDNLDVHYSPVPEPRTFAFGAGGIALGLAIWIRRKRDKVEIA